MAAHSASGTAFVVQADARQPASAGTMLAFRATGERHRFMANEPVELAPALRPSPHAVADLSVSSTIRPKRLHCASGLVIPWRSAGQHGWLVVGDLACDGQPLLARDIARSYGMKRQLAYAEAGARDGHRVRRQVTEAVRTIAAPEQQEHAAEDLFAATLAVGRGLLRTSAVYLSLPERSADIFTFSSFVGVRTGAFKRLRMGAGQGLGGVARDERRLVRSLNYAQDFGERDAPVHETVQEVFSPRCARR